MKVIDLLNKIANGEDVPKKISYKNKTYLFEGEILNYVNEYSEYDFLIGEDITAMLNDEVEVIEEDKKIEKLKPFQYLGNENNQSVINENFNRYFKETNNKINEIINYIKKEK